MIASRTWSNCSPRSWRTIAPRPASRSRRSIIGCARASGTSQHSAYPEAVGHLTKGLEVQQGLPAGVDRTRQELAYQAALGTALLAMKGYGAEETGRAFSRARKLCEELDDASQLFPVLYGEWGYQLVRARFPLARELEQQFLDRATTRQEPASLVVGHRLAGLCAFMLGDFSQAESHYEETLARYDPVQHRYLALHFGQDQRAACLANLAWLKWIVGRPADSLATSRAAVAYSREFDHVNTHAYVDFFTLFPLLFRRDVPAAEKQANALMALSKERRMSMWGAWAPIFSGWALGSGGTGRRPLRRFAMASPTRAPAARISADPSISRCWRKISRRAVRSRPVWKRWPRRWRWSTAPKSGGGRRKSIA